MKHIKMLGLAALAAFALTAVAGAGTASAGAIVCGNSSNPCTNILGKGTKIASQLKTGTVATLTSSTEVTCKKSSVGGVLTNGEGHGEITTFTFGECHTTSGDKCTVTAVNLPYTATATTGALDVTGKSGNPGATVDCGSFINCTFTVSSITLGVTNGEPAYISANKEPLNGSGFFCPSSAAWDATYQVTSPKGLWLI
jgi:hypothetical protein